MIAKTKVRAMMVRAYAKIVNTKVWAMTMTTTIGAATMTTTRLSVVAEQVTT
jgi:hypothetical protein